MKKQRERRQRARGEATADNRCVAAREDPIVVFCPKRPPLMIAAWPPGEDPIIVFCLKRPQLPPFNRPENHRAHQIPAVDNSPEDRRVRKPNSLPSVRRSKGEPDSSRKPRNRALHRPRTATKEAKPKAWHREGAVPQQMILRHHDATEDLSRQEPCNPNSGCSESHCTVSGDRKEAA
ncbi:hypothetical protein V6N12_009497 [Hibiscus sabdariffa]|uniref:Uncharacterized protein n=1 Tax=Hibiscus sabdariffa TaxID=183260 RepID=A0ABR2E9S2_9ROSI